MFSLQLRWLQNHYFFSFHNATSNGPFNPNMDVQQCKRSNVQVCLDVHPPALRKVPIPHDTAQNTKGMSIPCPKIVTPYPCHKIGCPVTATPLAAVNHQVLCFVISRWCLGDIDLESTHSFRNSYDFLTTFLPQAAQTQQPKIWINCTIQKDMNRKIPHGDQSTYCIMVSC